MVNSSKLYCKVCNYVDNTTWNCIFLNLDSEDEEFYDDEDPELYVDEEEHDEL